MGECAIREPTKRATKRQLLASATAEPPSTRMTRGPALQKRPGSCLFCCFDCQHLIFSGVAGGCRAGLDDRPRQRCFMATRAACRAVAAEGQHALARGMKFPGRVVCGTLFDANAGPHNNLAFEGIQACSPGINCLCCYQLRFRIGLGNQWLALSARRYCTASATCVTCTDVASARSAIVRATFKQR